MFIKLETCIPFYETETERCNWFSIENAKDVIENDKKYSVNSLMLYFKHEAYSK